MVVFVPTAHPFSGTTLLLGRLALELTPSSCMLPRQIIHHALICYYYVLSHKPRGMTYNGKFLSSHYNSWQGSATIDASRVRLNKHGQ